MIPLISVIIPTYNRKTIILDAIKSVLQQQPKNYEVLVVDDGSTDGTSEYLKSLHLPIEIIHKKNGGVASARNYGIKKAKGEYIAFLDSDDIWLPDILKTQLQYLIQNPSIPLVYTDQYFEENGKRKKKTRLMIKKWTDEELSQNNLPGFTKTPFMHISSIMVRKNIFHEVGYFNENLQIHEDTDMWNRISERYRLGYIKKPYSVLRWEKDTHHLLTPAKAYLFVSEGKKYLSFYENRRKGIVTPEEKQALKENYKRLTILDNFTTQYEHGLISAEVLTKKREALALNA